MSHLAGAIESPHATITDAALEELHAKTGLQLPADLQEFYTKSMNSISNAAAYCVNDACYLLGEVLPVSEGLNGLASTYRWLVKEGNAFGMSCVPFAEDGTSFFLYSLEPNTFGQIFYSSFIDEHYLQTQVVRLADSLGSFMQGLKHAVQDLV